MRADFENVHEKDCNANTAAETQRLREKLEGKPKRCDPTNTSCRNGRRPHSDFSNPDQMDGVLYRNADDGASSPVPVLLSTEPTFVMPLKCQQSTLHTGTMPSRSTPVVHHNADSRYSAGVFSTLPPAP